MALPRVWRSAVWGRPLVRLVPFFWVMPHTVQEVLGLCGTWGVSLGQSANTNDGLHLGCPSDVSTHSQRRLETDVCVAVATIGTCGSRNHCWVALLYGCCVASLCLQGKQSSSQKQTRSYCVHYNSLRLQRLVPI